MKFPLSFLKEIFPTKIESTRLASILTSLGIEVEKQSHEEGEEVCDVSLTPNLSHALCMMGIARELGAFLNEPVLLPRFSLKEDKEAHASSYLDIALHDEELAPRYMGRVLLDVKVGPSPEWLQKKLRLSGFRSVNNVVDATNYILLEMGLPLHAFDLDKLEGKKVEIRRAKKGEKIVTLDQKERFLTEEMLVICDAKKPQALAGVMGALESEVTTQTTRLFLEAAYFNPQSIRRTSKQLGMHTEASHRFERGVDPNALEWVLDRAASLLQEVCGGKVASGLLQAGKKHFPEALIPLRFARVNALLGTDLSASEIETLLKRMGTMLKPLGQDKIEVAIPSYRIDLKEEIDLIEEVARLYGYDNIHAKKRATYYQGSSLPDNPLYLFEKEARGALLKLGLQELLTCDLISEKESDLIARESLKKRFLVKIMNPRSLDQSVLRPSLLPNMLHVVTYNLAHERSTLLGFEIGRVHFKTKEGTFQEPTAISIVMTGESKPFHWESKTRPVDFFDLKGVLEGFFKLLHIPGVEFVPSTHENFQPGKQAKMMLGDVELGILGQLNPKTLKLSGIEESVFFAEFHLEDVMKAKVKEVKMQPLPLYPASARDWTFPLKTSISVLKVLEWIKEEKSKILENVSLLDVYQSEKLGSDSKNVTLHFVYRDLNGTVSFDAVESEHKRITERVLKKTHEG